MPLFEVSFNGYYAAPPSVGYTLFDGDGVAYQARTTSGVVNTVGNTFQVVISTGTLEVPTTIVWDDAGTPLTYASEAYNGSAGGGTAPVIIVNSDESCGS